MPLIVGYGRKGNFILEQPKMVYPIGLLLKPVQWYSAYLSLLFPQGSKTYCKGQK